MDHAPEPQEKPRPTGLVIGGAALALVAGVAIAWALLSGGQGERPAAPPASEGGLVIDNSALDDRLDPARPLRCFVAGQFVGELTLAQCAERNGVATGALDVGVDETGALAAAQDAGAAITPLPPQEEHPVAAEPEPAPTAPVAPVAPTAAQPATAACWRYVDNQWRKLPADMPLSACVQTLFAGRCERAGSATYGRWSHQTLRLMPGRVEVSGDNRSFRPLVEQGPGCNFPNFG